MESRLDHLYRLGSCWRTGALPRSTSTTTPTSRSPSRRTKMMLSSLQDIFPTPVQNHLPHVCPPQIQQAHFQAVLPRYPPPGPRPLVFQFAGTGDHFFWRRRNMMALPMVREKKVASINLENPFYGVRKPKDQLRSSLHHVSDLFLMGACLIMESLVLLKWAQKEGFGPLCCHGISMGGHMASLAATAWPLPIGLVPCLSWTSASVTFCQGVMSKAINWKLLEEQFNKTKEFKTDIWDLVDSPEFDSEKRYLGKHSIIMNLLSNLPCRKPHKDPNPEALHFMRGLMDECTHLGNYSLPMDTELVVAEYDAYQPRQGVVPLHQLWPGCRTRTIEEGHIMSHLFKQHVFRTAIYDVLERMVDKYPDHGL